MRRGNRRFISGCIRSAIALVALHGACAGRAQQLESEPVRAVPAPQRQEPANPPPVAAPRIEMVQDGQPTLAELVEANRQKYRALLISELQFCRVACDLTNQQSQQIARRAGPIVESAAVSAAKLELVPARRGGMRLADDRVPPNPIKLVRETLIKIVNELASPGQQGRYRVELEKRAAHRRQAATHDLVVRLDRMLILTSDQRARLLRLFESNWDDEWDVIGSILGDDAAPFPAIPDRLIVPCLSSAQQKLWKKCAKQAIDATDAYMSAVCELMEGLPSDFTAWLEAASIEAVKRPIAQQAPEKQKDASNRAAR
jgi:hypothetical protein